MPLAGRTPAPSRRGPRCRVCVFHTSLDPADQAEFTRWLDETEWTRNQILALLVEDGHTVKDLTENSFTIHRRRQCWGRRNGLV